MQCSWSSLELRVQFCLLVCCTYPSSSTVNKEKNLKDQRASLRVDTRETQHSQSAAPTQCSFTCCLAVVCCSLVAYCPSNMLVYLRDTSAQTSLRCFVGWLLIVPATSSCISGTDLLRQFYVLPHWDRSCRSNFLPYPVTVYWHRTNQSQRWPYNARRLA